MHQFKPASFLEFRDEALDAIDELCESVRYVRDAASDVERTVGHLIDEFDKKRAIEVSPR